jgi:hypothetical protein
MPRLPLTGDFLPAALFRPQNHGAVSRDACDQIERKVMPNSLDEHPIECS